MVPIVACVVGTRPEAVKMAPIIHRLRWPGSGFACRVIGSGQHQELLEQSLADFDLTADRDLGLMRAGQSLAELTAKALTSLYDCLAQERPDLVLAVGDTTTVFTSALACHYHRIPFGHVEAGLRTGDRYRPFPEEMNRELTARLAQMHFAPTVAARDHLIREGIDPRMIALTGNPVIDALQMTLKRHPKPPIVPPGDHYVLVTAHRRENWGVPMRQIAMALRDLVERNPTLGLIVPAHPNPEVRGPLTEAVGHHERVRLIEPVGYPAFVALMAGSAVILTDSGGVQEEGPALGKPVLVMRSETERPESVQGGARLVGTDREGIVAAVEACLAERSPGKPSSPFGDGFAAERIVRAIADRLGVDVASEGAAPPPWPPGD